MYQEFYGLDADPFRLSPDHGYCLRHPTFQKAKAYMQFAAHRAEGFVMITGRPGTGKTTLIEDVLADIEGREVVAAKLVSAQLQAEDLLRMTAFNFGIAAADKNKSDLLMEMQGFFANCLADGQRPLLVIDEAQGLSLNALEELRLLTNLHINGQPMLQIFLVGQEELRDLVLNPQMEQLHQRIIATCHLEPLDFRQTAAYVMHRLKVSGWKGKPRIRAHIFKPLCSFSQGIPRRINLFMGRLLLHGWLEEKSELGAPEAETVLAELKSEHLAPTRANDLLDENQANCPDQEIDPELLMPDQKIGAKLMEKAKETAPSGKTAGNGQGERLQTQPDSSAEHPPESIPQPIRAETPPAETRTISLGARLKAGLRKHLGLALSLFVGAILALGLLLISPMTPNPGSLAHALLRDSGLFSLRARVHRWTGGNLPLSSAEPKGDDGAYHYPRATNRTGDPV